MSLVEASTIAMRAVYKQLSDPYVDKYLIGIGRYTANPTHELYTKDPVGHFVGFLKWLLQKCHQNPESDDEDDSGIANDSATSFSTIAAKPSRPFAKDKKPFSPTPKPSASTSQTSPSPSKPKPYDKTGFSCAFCKKDHADDSCPLDIDARHAIADQLKLCRCCVKTGHQAKECPSEVTYYPCGMQNKWRRHHTSLCKSDAAALARKKGVKPDWKSYWALRDNSEEYKKMAFAKKVRSPNKTAKAVRVALAKVFEKAFKTSWTETSESESED